MLILASASKSRRNLLKNSDINFIQLSSSFDESLIKEKNIKDLALKLSLSKAELIKNKIIEINLDKNLLLSSFQILGCDSIFEFNGKAFGKPKSKEDAYQRWLEMSANFGFLHTGHTLLFCQLINNSENLIVKKKVQKIVSSKIYFARLRNVEISKYIDSLEPLNCAGGFALEGKGGKFIEKLEGCFSNVMGLSLPWLRKELIKEEIIA